MPEFDVSICLPDLKKLKHLTERYKALGQAVTITVSRRGALSFKVDGEEGVFSTHYPNQRVPGDLLKTTCTFVQQITF